MRLLALGKTDKRGLGPNRASHNAFYKIVHRIDEVPSLKAWTLLGDLPAGPRQAAYDWAPYARHYLLVVEPTWQGMLTARRIVRIARAQRDAEFSLIVNKVTPEADVERAEQFLGIPLLGTVPADDGVHAAERAGVALLDAAPDSPAVHAIERLVEALDASNMDRL